MFTLYNLKNIKTILTLASMVIALLASSYGLYKSYKADEYETAMNRWKTNYNSITQEVDTLRDAYGRMVIRTRETTVTKKEFTEVIERNKYLSDKLKSSDLKVKYIDRYIEVSTSTKSSSDGFKIDSTIECLPNINDSIQYGFKGQYINGLVTIYGDGSCNVKSQSFDTITAICYTKKELKNKPKTKFGEWFKSTKLGFFLATKEPVSRVEWRTSNPDTKFKKSINYKIEE